MLEFLRVKFTELQGPFKNDVVYFPGLRLCIHYAYTSAQVLCWKVEVGIFIV